MNITRKNKMLVGCLALLLALSVGYALFSETITINGTATAKGNFAFKIETMKGINEDIKSNDMYALLDHYGNRASEMDFKYAEGVDESSISHTTNTITFSASITNAGQGQYFTAKITNTGSIPIVFDMYYDFQENVSMTGNLIMNDGYLLDVNKVKDAALGGEGSNYGITGGDYGNLTNLKSSLTSLNDIYVSEDIFNRLDTDFNNGIDALPIIETGKSIYLLFHSTWGDNILFTSNIVGVDVEAENTITLPVKQYTGN